MRLFYTLIVSGFLILTEIPAEQPPPFTHLAEYPPTHTIAQAKSSFGVGTTVDLEFVASSFVPFAHFNSETSGWNLVFTSEKFLGLPGYLLPNQVQESSKPILWEVQKQPIAAVAHSQDAPTTVPAEMKATVTPLPMLTPAVPTSAVSTPVVASMPAELATYRQQSTLPISGYAMFYNPNVMQEVLNNRLKMGHVTSCADCIGNVALLRAGDLNRRVWLQWPDGSVEGPFLVADVAATHHVAQLLARNWVVDVDNRTAVRRKMAGPVMVTVLASPPTGVDVQTIPFAPLYAVLPTAAVPTAIATQNPPVLATQPVDPTSTPTVSPLPLVTNTPTTPATQASMVTTSEIATMTPLPVIVNAVAAPTLPPPVVQEGFPTETPVPTMTPLPIIPATATLAPSATPNPTDTVIDAATATPLAISTPTVTLTATLIATPSLAPTGLPTIAASDVVTSNVVLQHGFPPDTPVPTMTPLPVITPLPTATPTLYVN